ncbi:hypothetical protein QBZ16_001001 [Prototheca wickerhamii]|uniref:pyruvate kinase n=1 Tax=Prototheca wickerhamii TaxID=3111 RepID=A0AAD9IE03_PROWI|nr:hypothetical protein QBZ16_001001 [Prototheca wickerhamii]
MALSHTTKAKTHFFEDSDLKQVLHVDDTANSFVKTKVTFTIGSGSRSVEKLCQILEAGATCARIDLTWNSLEYHKKSLANLMEAMKRTRRLCAVMVDVQGREITINRPEVAQDNDGTHREPDATVIEAGSTITITTDLSQKFSADTLPVSYARFPDMVEPGDDIFVGRYLVSGADASSLYLRVDSATETTVTCTAQSGAVLAGLLTVFHTERSDSSVANQQNDLPPLTEHDKAALRELVTEFDLDFVSLSYCRESDDVDQVRAFLHSIGSSATKIVA